MNNFLIVLKTTILHSSRIFSSPQKKRKFVSIKKIPTKNQEFCEYENRNCFFVPKFAFGLGFERKDSFTPNNTPSSP